MADYLKASGEDRPDMTVEVWLDGKKHKEVKIDAKNLFTFDNKLRARRRRGRDRQAHARDQRRRARGPVYFNAYLTNFTLEDFITKAGLEVKVNRKYYKLTQVDETIKVAGSRGQAARPEGREVRARGTGEPGRRSRAATWSKSNWRSTARTTTSTCSSRTRRRPASSRCEVRSGYNGNDLGAYMELRDEPRVLLRPHAGPRQAQRQLSACGPRSPASFSALPTRAVGDVRPGAEGNSDEIKLKVKD